MHATAEVQCSFLEAVTCGKKQVKSFVSASLTVGGTNSLYSRIKKISCKNICSHEKVSDDIRSQSGTSFRELLLFQNVVMTYIWKPSRLELYHQSCSTKMEP